MAKGFPGKKTQEALTIKEQQKCSGIQAGALEDREQGLQSLVSLTARVLTPKDQQLNLCLLHAGYSKSGAISLCLEYLE